MLTLTATYKVLKALKVPDAEISRVLASGEHDIELPDVFVLTAEELRGKKNMWKRNQKRIDSKRLEAAA